MCLPTGRPMPERSRRDEATDRPTTPFPPMICDATLLNLPAIFFLFPPPIDFTKLPLTLCTAQSVDSSFSELNKRFTVSTAEADFRKRRRGLRCYDAVSVKRCRIYLDFVCRIFYFSGPLTLGSSDPLLDGLGYNRQTQLQKLFLSILGDCLLLSHLTHLKSFYLFIYYFNFIFN